MVGALVGLCVVLLRAAHIGDELVIRGAAGRCLRRAETVRVGVIEVARPSALAVGRSWDVGCRKPPTFAFANSNITRRSQAGSRQLVGR
jgi:hypothetical protein